MNDTFDWKKYLIVFLLTLGLFFVASYLSNYFSDKKINQLKLIQDEVAINILSSETQFSLLQDLSCKTLSDSIFSGELDELGKKLEWGQENLGNTQEVSYLKKYYSLLEIKDYLLTKQISARCKVKAAFILYFYTTAENCSECQKQEIVLSTLRERYPELRVYSFDFNTDLSAVLAMIKIYKIEDTKLPALVVDEDLLTGFRSIEELESRIKESFKLQETKPADKTQPSS
ncbi:MAG: hypothetical protein AAB815_01120 [Patescibacteria group bacterium]